MLSEEVPGLSFSTSWFDGVLYRPKTGTGGVTLFTLLVCEELRFCNLRLGRFLSYWLVIVVVIVVVGLIGGEAWRRGSMGDSERLRPLGPLLEACVSPESGLELFPPHGVFSWLVAVSFPLPDPVPLPLDEFSTRRLCQELFP
jgi:hypothetical protein